MSTATQDEPTTSGKSPLAPLAWYTPKPYYQADGITIYHGDCKQIMPVLNECDLLLTDPPYGINADRDRNSQKNGWKDYGSSGWDKEAPPSWLIEMLLSSAKQSIIWGGNYFNLPPRMRWLIWDKGQRDFSLADCELAWTSENKAARVYEYARAKALKEGKQHPTQKPVPLMQWCIELAGEVETVIDPFAGTGTTGVAAKRMNKQCVLIEREERYCEIAVARLAQGVLGL